MNNQTSNSCWTVTAWALIGLAAIMIVTFFAGADMGDVASATIATNS